MLSLVKDIYQFQPLFLVGLLKDHLKVEKEYDGTITYCGGGIAATVNAIAYLMAGKDNIAVYDGSLSEWIGEGLPTTTVESA